MPDETDWVCVERIDSTRFTGLGKFHVLHDAGWLWTYSSLVKDGGGQTTRNILEADHVVIDIDYTRRNDQSLPDLPRPVTWIDRDWVHYRATTWDGHPIENGIVDPHNLPRGIYPSYQVHFTTPTPQTQAQRTPAPDPSLYIPKKHHRMAGGIGPHSPRAGTKAVHRAPAGTSSQARPASQIALASSPLSPYNPRTSRSSDEPLRLGFDRCETNLSPKEAVSSSPSATTLPSSNSHPRTDLTSKPAATGSDASVNGTSIITPTKDNDVTVPSALQPRSPSEEPPPGPPAPPPAADPAPLECARPPDKRGNPFESEGNTRPPKSIRSLGSLADAAARLRSSAPRTTATCSWIRDLDLLAYAARGLLRPLELIRLLPLDLIYKLGIDVALWETTPAVFPTSEAQVGRRETFAIAFAAQSTFDLAWAHYQDVAAELGSDPPLQVVRVFASRLHVIRQLRLRFGWPTVVRVLHDQIERSVSQGIELSSSHWLDAAQASIACFEVNDTGVMPPRELEPAMKRADSDVAARP